MRFATGLATRGEGKERIEGERCEHPAEVVAERDAKDRTSVAPYPSVIEGSPVGIHRQVPCRHDNRGEQRLKKKVRVQGRENETRDDPGAVADAEISKDQKEGKAKEPGPHDRGEGIVAEGKASAETQALGDSGGA